MPRILSLDVGTSSVRGQIFEPEAEERTPARRDYAGENDPERIVELVREVLKEAATESYDAAGTSSFGHSLLALDHAGRPLTEVLSWRDTRSADAADTLLRRL
ncbi:MAG: gluconokinase, partial [Gaiellaceae bacterium]|nr:gluconokinase [Gaiellaceae bacterium]